MICVAKPAGRDFQDTVAHWVWQKSQKDTRGVYPVSKCFGGHLGRGKKLSKVTVYNVKFVCLRATGAKKSCFLYLLSVFSFGASGNLGKRR